MKLSTFTYPDTNQTAIPNTTIKNPDRTLVVMFGPSHLLDAAAPIQWSWLRTQEPLPLGAPAPEKFSRRISRTTRWSLPSSNSSTQQFRTASAPVTDPGQSFDAAQFLVYRSL